VCLGAGVALGGALGGAATYILTPRKEPEEERTFSGHGATKVKITVLKRFSPDEVVLPVKAPYYIPCPIFHEGQEFYVDAERPKIETSLIPGSGAWGCFCPYAWDAIFPHAWEDYEQGEGKDKVTVWACPDGFRPVILKLEWI